MELWELNEAYFVKIDAFEGPLDLLLHLINDYEIDIYDVPMAEIADQYNDYIQTMQKLELNIASEYLVMAATLLAIKSQMLLPKQTVDTVDEYEEDPREELIQRLIEYRKYKTGAGYLEKLEDDRNTVYMRAPTIFNESFYKPDIQKGRQSVYDLLHAFDRMLMRKQWENPRDATVTKIEIPIEQRMTEVLRIVQNEKAGVLFDDLFVNKSRSYIVVTFIAVLELMKNNLIDCQQKENFAELFIYDCSYSNNMGD